MLRTLTHRLVGWFGRPKPAPLAVHAPDLPALRDYDTHFDTEALSAYHVILSCAPEVWSSNWGTRPRQPIALLKPSFCTFYSAFEQRQRFLHTITNPEATLSPSWDDENAYYDERRWTDALAAKPGRQRSSARRAAKQRHFSRRKSTREHVRISSSSSSSSSSGSPEADGGRSLFNNFDASDGGARVRRNHKMFDNLYTVNEEPSPKRVFPSPTPSSRSPASLSPHLSPSLSPTLSPSLSPPLPSSVSSQLPPPLVLQREPDVLAKTKVQQGSLKKLNFTTAGRFVLGLGTLGVFANAARTDRPDLKPSAFNFRTFSGVDATDGDELPFKRKLFQNLYDIFGLNPTSPTSSETQDASAQDTAGIAPKPEESPFNRLVVGDRLVLREGDITRDQWTALSNFLAACPHIKSLRLQGIEITAREAEELGKGLQQIHNITFCDNSIGLNEGCLEKLVALLLCCGLLESTSIIRNSLGDSHVPHILLLMKHHSSLSRISLAWNGIGDTGASKVASLLHVLRSSIQDVDLSYNSIGCKGLGALVKSAKKRAESGAPKINLWLQHNEGINALLREHRELDDEVDPPWYFGANHGGSKENVTPSPHEHEAGAGVSVGTGPRTHTRVFKKAKTGT